MLSVIICFLCHAYSLTAPLTWLLNNSPYVPQTQEGNWHLAILYEKKKKKKAGFWRTVLHELFVTPEQLLCYS